MTKATCPECGHHFEIEDKTPKRVVRWGVALVYTALIFSFAPLVLPLWNLLARLLTLEGAGSTLNNGVIIVGLVTATGILLYARERRVPTYFWLAAVLGGYAYLVTLHCEYPVERVHTIQYSLLAWFFFRALRLDLSEVPSYVLAAVAVFLVGAADEGLQDLIPDRSSSLDDMITNWAAGGLGLVGLIAVQRGVMWDWFARRRAALRLSLGYAVPALIVAGFSHQVWTRYLHPPLNLFLITVDCLRPDHMGIYGYERNTTEFLDTIKDQAAVFTNVYSQAAWTSPGVASTLTGLYPPAHGVTSSDKSVLKTLTTVLDAFKERGYRIPNMTFLTSAPNFMNLGEFDEQVIEENTIDEIAVINAWIARNHREPFAAWYHWRHTHLPYEPEPKHRKFPPADDLKAEPPPNVKDVLMKEVIIPSGMVEWTEEDGPWIKALYDAQVRQFDHSFEAIRYRLALHHKLKHTIFVITADHGEELLERGEVGHASTLVHSKHYDEDIHIPLIIYCPRLIKKGRVIDTMAQQVDILPTIFDMMGWPIPEEVQGRSLWPAIRGEPMEDVPVFAESVEGGYQSKPDQRATFVRSVRTREWKLIGRMGPQGDHYEMFNLVDDPRETKNVLVEHPELMQDMLPLLMNWISQNHTLRVALEEREELHDNIVAAMDPANLEVPVILEPKDGDVIRFEDTGGLIKARWTGNPYASYIIEYDVGEGWHKLTGYYPVEIGTEQNFGPIPRDGWKPLYQWNPYRVRIRPKGLPDGWSDWITVTVAPVQAAGH